VHYSPLGTGISMDRITLRKSPLAILPIRQPVQKLICKATNEIKDC